LRIVFKNTLAISWRYRRSSSDGNDLFHLIKETRVMTKRQIFYSFHYENDVMRVNQVRNIGALEDNQPVSVNSWEEVKRGGDASIKKWIDDNMKYRSCVVVLVGEHTAYRPWVKYEIKKAWEDGKGLLAIRINRLNCPRNGISPYGPNPFDSLRFIQQGRVIVPKTHDPNLLNPLKDIAANLERWIEDAIRQRY
jgi:hypothetical protein